MAGSVTNIGGCCCRGARAAPAMDAAAAAPLPQAPASGHQVSAGGPLAAPGITVGQPAAASAAALGSAVAGGAPAATSSVIPMTLDGNIDLRLGVGQTTYRQVVLQGGAGGSAYDIPAPGDRGGVGVETYQVVKYRRGAHDTEALVPVQGRISVGAGQQLRLITRITGLRPGSHDSSLGFGRLTVEVTQRVVKPLPMLAWVNASSAASRGASTGQVEQVLQHFGVASTGVEGAGSRVNGMPIDRFYFSAAYEAANKAPVAEVARRVLQAEAQLRASNPGATLWVQVSDEQDKDAQQVHGTVQWISQLRGLLAQHGSGAKLFVATQARDYNMGYASVIDGWATTQSTVGVGSRDNSTALIRAAAARQGRAIEVMEYPGNAFFDGQTPGGPAVSVATAGIDGASSWFLFAANNLDTLERGVGEEGRGDIGGLVGIHNGAVVPTLALAESEYGANLAGVVRAVGAQAAQTLGARQVRAVGQQLDAYRPGHIANFAQWENEIELLL